jgi:hypothetical protein
VSGTPVLRTTELRSPRFGRADGDRIHVTAILLYSEGAIYVEGHVARPGRRSYREGICLSEVLHNNRMVRQSAALQ